MFGKKYMGIDRTTLLIDKAQKIYKIWEKVNPNKHAQEVLNTTKILMECIS